MPKRNLLICFDAFGTLFSPKRPIAQQYGEVARWLGLGGFTDEQLQDSFKKAFKAEAKTNPNFGKANGMDATAWWTNIIRNTFQPLVGGQQEIHADLAPKLLHRFASEEGYTLAPGAKRLLRGLRKPIDGSEGRTVVGLITNSDDRVPGVLSSLGLTVSSLRYDNTSFSNFDNKKQYDIDFSVMSYDVGCEKPDKRIFSAAEEIWRQLPGGADPRDDEWDKVYVGDEYGKDVVGAQAAGWHSVLIAEDRSTLPHDVKDIEEKHPGDLSPLLQDQQSNVAISSLERLAHWFGIP
ncbi:hypothetical protein D0863_07172 [Hortaea werneckii]|uniref:Uncharacterized protein n=1 Tax=Hortaea werneckii TaxID=91943 RepID=A0A3M7DVM0_HORWE|nr:hypothetical protein D0863_07172 [Hortaea werneckii]